jgi:hypothetical protein
MAAAFTAALFDRHADIVARDLIGISKAADALRRFGLASSPSLSRRFGSTTA